MLESKGRTQLVEQTLKGGDALYVVSQVVMEVMRKQRSLDLRA